MTKKGHSEIWKSPGPALALNGHVHRSLMLNGKDY